MQNIVYQIATHPEYDKNLPKWQKIDDAINGKPAVDKYLRDVGCNEPDKKYAQERQKEYIDGAIWFGFTLNTLDGFVGSIYRKKPVIEIPPQLDYLIGNVDGNGLTLVQQSKESTRQVIGKGRQGLLVDMPNVEETPSIEQQENGEIVPRIQTYLSQAIINWRTKRVGSINILTMIVLAEPYDRDISDSEFLLGGDDYDFYDVQYRVLGIDDEGYYYQEIWYQERKEGELITDMVDGKVKRVYPVQNGSRMRSIPFYFIGSSDNDYKVDPAPLGSIADLNIGHYRNNADTEENSFIASQAMLVISLGEGVTSQDFNEANPNGVRIGARRGLNVGAGGSASFIQADESDKAMRLMKEKEEQAIAIGAQMITPSVNITAESARIQNGANTSQLSTIADNVSEAYTMALQQCALFLGSSDDVSFKLNQDFFFKSMTAQERAQWVNEVMQGITPISYYYRALREAGEFPSDATDEEIATLIEQNPGI